jgi:hypothetical protein
MAMVRGKMRSGVNTNKVVGEPCKTHTWASVKQLSMRLDDNGEHSVVLPFVDKCNDCNAIRAVVDWPVIVQKHAERLGITLVTV